MLVLEINLQTEIINVIFTPLYALSRLSVLFFYLVEDPVIDVPLDFQFFVDYRHRVRQVKVDFLEKVRMLFYIGKIHLDLINSRAVLFHCRLEIH